MSLIPLFISNSLGNINATGNSVFMQCNPPIDLSNDDYYCGLVSASINYCNPNIIKGQNSKFVYGTYSSGSLTNIQSFDFDTGLYSLDEIQNFLSRKTNLMSGNSSIFALQGDSSRS